MFHQSHFLIANYINQSINQIYVVSLQDPYSEAQPTQAKKKKSSLQQLVKLQTGAAWEAADSQGKPVE